MTDDPRVSIITTCKGRLEHLRQTLPQMLAQPHAEVIVVDYDCPQQTADWVATTHPRAKPIRVPDEPRFCLSRARNVGAEVAKGEWLLFVDADIRLADCFVADILPRLTSQSTFRADRFDHNTQGTIICRRADFAQIDGYDEVIKGWGGEDDDVLRRMDRLGCGRKSFSADLIAPIIHDDRLRVENYEIPNMLVSQRINAFYLQIKHDLMRMIDMELPLSLRQQIYEQVRQACFIAIKSSSSTVRLELNLPGGLVFPVLEPDWRLLRRWLYQFEWKPEQ